MDRSLDERIADRQRTNTRGQRPPPRRNDYPRDGIKKSSRDNRQNLDNDWVHDRFDDEPNTRRNRSRNRNDRTENYNRESPESEQVSTPAKLRVDNLHYDLTEDDLYDLFTRIAPVSDIKLRYDRAGRSDGTAFVTYPNLTDAREAIREFDGANAKGQPIRLTLLPSGPAGGRARPVGRKDNPFDRVESPRTLFDRIEAPKSRRGGRDRSASPDGYGSYEDRVGRNDSKRGASRRGPPSSHDRRSDVSKPAPDGIDRYIPGQSNGRSPSRRNGGRENGRRPGERRERGGGGGGRGGRDRSEREENGGRMVNGRPRKTQEELDAEMEDYWGSAHASDPNPAAAVIDSALSVAAPVAVADDDIDMIE